MHPKIKIVAGSLSLGDRPEGTPDFMVKSFGATWRRKDVKYQYAYLFYSPRDKPDSHKGHLR